MHEKVLPKRSVELLAKLGESQAPTLERWILAGGTGLALQLGHRISRDFDFFRTDAVDVRQLHEVFRALGDYETLQEAERTLTVIMCGIKVSFFRIADPFLYPPALYRFFSIADVRDIALMKLIAVSSRGSRRDFIDLYTILRDGPLLQEHFKALPKRYGQGRVNTYHVLKSLTYFEDAEKEPMPAMLVPFSWEECKHFFVRQAHAIVLPPGLTWQRPQE